MSAPRATTRDLSSARLPLAARRQSFVAGLGIRALAGGVFAVFFFALGATGAARSDLMYPAAIVLALLALINIPYWWFAARTGFPTEQFIVHWAVDIVLLTVMIHLIGGIQAPYCALAYLSLVLFSAVNDSRAAAMKLAAFSLLSFSVLVALEATGVVTPVRGLWEHHYGPVAQLFAFVTPFLFVFELAWVGGTLADQLKAANASLVQFSARIEEQNKTLEHRVAERTAELARAHQEIEDLVHIVTHDLKNVSVASTETARKLVERESQTLSPRGRKYAANLLEDGRNMTRMLEHLLSLFRDADPNRSLCEWVDVDQVVRQVFDRLHYQIEAKAIEVEIGALPALFAEPAKIRHIFDNLIDNACKYVGETKPARVEVRGERQGDRVRYFVRDNGIGIEERQLARIFQLYHRSPRQTVNGEAQAGHGVGLAIVKRIVERYGGEIGVESAPHRGSTFFVSFPTDAEPAP